MSEHNLTPPADSRPIARAPGYRICDGGTIYSCRLNAGVISNRWHVLKPGKPIRSGYINVVLRVGRKPVTFLVHHLVLEAFKGLRPPGFECCHCDGNRVNNFAENLRWDTRKSNCKDRDKHGRTARGEKIGLAKLKETDIHEIFRLSEQGLSQDQIGKIYGVTQGNISPILRRETWAHVKIEPELLAAVSAVYSKDNGMPKLKDSDIPNIFRLYSEGMTKTDISKMYNVSRSNIYLILKRVIWSHVPI
jgi:hypothetical protein